MAPFALLGVRQQGWWITMAVLFVLTLPLPWGQYVIAVLNARSAFGPDYLLGELPIAALLALGTWRR